MSYNGSGTFNINTAGQPVVTGTVITSTAFNLLTADLASGLTTALTKDGQTTPTANIPMGTFKITGLGAGTALTDAAQFGQLQAGATQIATVTGTDTLAGTLTPTPTAYATGNLFSFVAVNTNTGAATINLNSLGAKSITKLGSTALAAGDIVSGRIYLIEYDGTRFQLINPSASSVSSFSAGSTGLTPSSATTGAVTLAGTLATTNGGTGLTSFTSGGVVYASSTSALATGSALQFDGTSLGVNCTPSSFTNFTYLSINGTTGSILSLRSNNTTQFELNTTGSLNNFNSVTTLPFVWSINSAEQMRLTSTGLGIGTSSPQLKFVVSNGGAAGVEVSPTGGNQGGTYFQSYNRSGTAFVATEIIASKIGFYTGTSPAFAALLDSSGNLGLGVTPVASVYTPSRNFFIGQASNLIGRTNINFTSLNTNVYEAPTTSAPTYINSASAAAQYTQYLGQHTWNTAPSGTAGNAITFTQAMTLDANGNLLVGPTSYSPTNASGIILGGPNLSTTGTIIIGHANGTVTASQYAIFNYNSGAIGSITQSGTTAVLYNVTSDQRLKENIVDAPEFGSVIDSLQVRSYDWKTDHTHQRAGFVAQELVNVAPEAVHQPADPNDMMAVDYSKLVPMLVKEIQSLRKRLAAAGI